MDIKISSIQIRCKEKNIFIQLSNRISFIYGNAGVGKTTLLNLISYGLGNDLVKTLAIEQKVLGVCLNIMLNGELICLERKINSNSIIVSRNNQKISLVAKKEKLTTLQSFSDFLYLNEGIKPIEMLRKNSSKEIKVNFSNYMWFSYLKQEELDNTLFYLGEKNVNYKELASNYVVKILLGEKEVSDKEINKEINKLREKKESLELRLLSINEICSSIKLLDLNLSQEIVKKQKKIINLKQETKKMVIEILKNNISIEAKKINDLLENQRMIGIYEAEIRYLGEFGKINVIRDKYSVSLQQFDKQIMYYESMKNSSSNENFYTNLNKLEKIFFECLHDVKFSYIESSDHVKIDKLKFTPSIYSQYGDFKFNYNNLSSGGKKTIFKICYALAIHIFVIESNIYSILPQFIMIDTPMKNISEREDKDLYENLYRFLVKLFSEGGKLEKVQLILVDKECPLLFDGEDIMCKHMTNDDPLIP